MVDESIVSQVGLDGIESVAPLFDEYRRFYKQTSDLPGARLFLQDRVSKNESVVFVARLNRKPVGFTQLYPSFSSVRMKKIWILNDLFVLPEVRKQGVATTLINAAVSLARETGAHHLVLSTAKVNPAQKLYRHYGWKLDDEFDQFYFDLV